MSKTIDTHHITQGWIGVDLDGTLAVYDGWRGPYHIGAPIPTMVERVKKWLEEGEDVRIFTARVTDSKTNTDGSEHDLEKVRRAIDRYCIEHIGQALPITNVKDWSMKELWDDRAVQVQTNTGVVLEEELRAAKFICASLQKSVGQYIGIKRRERT